MFPQLRVVRTPQCSQCPGVIPLRAGTLVSGSAPPSPPQSLFLHISLLLFGRMSERDIQSLSKWVFVLSLCLTTLWGRLTLASTHHHRSHSGRGERSLERGRRTYGEVDAGVAGGTGVTEVTGRAVQPAAQANAWILGHLLSASCLCLERAFIG